MFPPLADDRRFIPSFFLLVISCGRFAWGQVELAPDSKTGLFGIHEDSAPLVGAHYVGWGAKWKWDQPQVKVGGPKGTSTPFALHFKDLAVDGTGARTTVGANRVSWTYFFSFKRDRKAVIGGGIEFALKLDSPVRQGAQAVPELLDGNRGWEWEHKPGQMVRVLFEPGIANVYFE
ncbi:MAG: hypothetical protein HON70_22230, partial [Lentisphaerae bacterium]|nr:hypothetical protein [Lentisphaerota bacterium]